jgi:hypothetical protein
MSFLDDLSSIASGVGSWFKAGGIGPTLAKTAITGYALKKVTDSINRDNVKSAGAADQGQRIQLDPNTENKIPVVYGSAFVNGIITDVFLSPDNKTLHYVLALSEKTGNVNLGQGAASAFTFKKCYWNDLLITFKSDGVTVASATDRAGNVNTQIDSKIAVYFYDGNRISGKLPQGFSGSAANANSIMPGWTTNHNMSDLVFAIIKLEYNKEAGITSLGSFRFHIENTMTEPGDCIYDYMTNTRYGAGIAASEINGL